MRDPVVTPALFDAPAPRRREAMIPMREENR
jgi:hypothetical protein